ncbi:hypothetical protein AQ983_16840 [Clostridium pasteurianum DSM 525 = ATCC 6013]|nr:hypothetical protein AQ983_16840 [Clostridium pasteurianum DSM 525 = ATCC 6013]AOZ81181.1 hypothetical protein AQ984_16835 [Clostridium pasteurianum]
MQTIEVGGKTYPIVFDFNVLSELEDIYGDVSKAFEDLEKVKIKAIRALVYSLIKVEDEEITLKDVGKMLDMDFINKFVEKAGIALNNDMPEVTTGNVGE